MKKISFYILMVLAMTFIWSCNTERSTEPIQPQMADKLTRSSWVVSEVLAKTSRLEGAPFQRISDDMTKFKMTLYSDRSYVIYSEVPDVIPSSTGIWNLEENGTVITFDFGSGTPMRADILSLTDRNFDFKMLNKTYKVEPREFIFKLIPSI